MTELELAQHTADVTRWVAYFGFALWGAAGWYVGRFFLKKNYIKPTGLINMRVVRQIENDNFQKNKLIKALTKSLNAFEEENKSLWSWSYKPHRDAHSITIKQVDKNGEEVAYSDITLPPRKHWVEPVGYIDDDYADFQEWKDSLPHNQPKD